MGAIIVYLSIRSYRVSREKKIVWSIVVGSIMLWCVDILFRYKSGDWSVWLWRKELIHLTGVMAFIPMGVIMILALRPKWLEPYCHGLDKIYYIHKWLGIWSIVSVILHYGMKLSKTFLRPYFERGPKLGGDKLLLLEEYRSLAKVTGEWLFYLFVAMLVITLLKRIPYRFWRWIHKLMPFLFVAAVFHTIVLMPARYWGEPVGIVLLLLSLGGLIAALLSLLGKIGERAQFLGKIIDLEQQGDVMLVTCEVEKGWQHDAGEYAFVRHEKSYEAHPFTIASADRGDGIIRFAIKALGHYTRQIATVWQVGDRVRVEGGYGAFHFRNDAMPKQIWIAGGVGITPFIAWMESLQNEPINRMVTLYYCVSKEHECLVPEYLRSLAKQSGIQLILHCSHQAGHLDPATLPIDEETSIWFCGPARFGRRIQQVIKAKSLPLHKHFYREYFDMR